MRDELPGYYAPVDADLKALWAEARIVVDANVLLHPYKVATATRKELLELLEVLKDRIWIPHQVALEFQENRLRVIASERKGIEKMLSETGDSLQSITASINKLELDKRGINVEPQPLLDDLSAAHTKIEAAIRKAQSELIEIGHADPIRERLDSILRKKIGPAPADQPALDSLLKDAKARYEDRIPPGFRDAAKEQNPAEAHFVAGGIKYPRQYGDLILWRQTMEDAREQHIKHLIFVTADNKEDWWWRVDGQTVGPLPELISEIRRVAGVENFWIYRLSSFMQQARERLGAKVSDKALRDVQEVSSRPVAFAEIKTEQLSSFWNEWMHRHSEPTEFENEVLYWLTNRGVEPVFSREFPRIAVHFSDAVSGYDTCTVGAWQHVLADMNVVKKLARGREAIEAGTLTEFSLIIGVPEDEHQRLCARPGAQMVITAMLRKMQTMHRVTAIHVGSSVHGVFTELASSAG